MVGSVTAAGEMVLVLNVGTDARSRCVSVLAITPASSPDFVLPKSHEALIISTANDSAVKAPGVKFPDGGEIIPIYILLVEAVGANEMDAKVKSVLPNSSRSNQFDSRPRPGSTRCCLIVSLHDLAS